MDIFFSVRVAVVMAMMRCPPQWSPLNGGIADNSKHKLPEPIGFECIVGEIAMVESCDRKHPNEIKPDSRENGKPAPSHPNHAQTHHVHDHEWKDSKPIDFLESGVRYLISRRIRVNPAPERQ